MENVYELVSVVVSFLIGLVASWAKYKKFKEVLEEGADVMVETAELVTTAKDVVEEINSALADDAVTKDEAKAVAEKARQVMKEGEDVIREFNEFVGKVKELFGDILKNK